MRYYIFKFSIFTIFICLLASCGNDNTAESSSESLFDVIASNSSQDTVTQFGFEVDLVRIEQEFDLMHGDRKIPVQIGDRNNNGTPDKMFAMVDVPAGRLIRMAAFNSSGNADPATALVGVNAVKDGEKLELLSAYTADGQWDGDGIILDNEWIGFRYLMQPPFAFDIIGKRQESLLTSDQIAGLDNRSAWGGDALAEGQSLGIGSPALFDQADIIPLSSFDTKEITVIETGPLRAEVEIVTRGIPIRGEKIDVMIKWQLEGGKHWTGLEVSILSKTDLNLQIAFGLPKHKDATDFTQGLISNTHFAYTYGLQDANGEQLGMAILVPGRYEVDTYREDPHNYFYLVNPQQQKVQYRVMASWGKGRKMVIDEVDFINVIKEYCAQYGATVQIKSDFHLN
ncbi:MAG: DUF4861 family protein [Saprospiraceae bacterium]|nr:DUF4861 family protein [Saprospiraceae bacterium]